MSKTEHYYGWHSVTAVLETTPELVVQIFVQKGRDDKRFKELEPIAQTLGVTVQFAGKDTLTRMAQTEHHQGIVANVRMLPSLNEHDLAQLIETTPEPFLLILDQITDPHNLGACIRSAVSMGVDAIICPKDRSATLTPTARKTAAGAADHIKFIQVTNLARTIESIKEAGVFVIGTLLDETSSPLAACNLKGKLAIVMGAEDTGMRRLTKELCDQTAYIPMYGPLQSLNVSVACGMALYEAAKQRNTTA